MFRDLKFTRALLLCLFCISGPLSAGSTSDDLTTAIVSLDQAQQVIEIIVEANFDDEDVETLAQCILKAADKATIGALIMAAETGVEQSHVDAVVDLSHKASTMACVREHALI